MRGEPTTPTAGRSAIDAIASARDRDRAFRSAGRHTVFVKLLRLALPLVAIGSLGMFGGWMLVTSRLKGRDISVTSISVDPTNLKMADPRYSGFSKDGAEYRVHAKSAVTDLKMAAPVRLDEIDGEITQPTGVVTRLKATWGTYDQKKELLELYERIDVDASNGMRARLTRATVLPKESRITSPEPIWAETETGIIRANSMALDSKGRKASFRDAVEVTLKPGQQQAAALKAADGAAPQRPRRDGTLAFGLDTNSGEPVIVTSHALDVDDTAKTALFREAVVARQGEAQIQAPELDVIYAGQAASTAGAAKSADGGEATKLKRIKARGGVVMSSKGDRADSETLDYDADTGQVSLAGKVVMTQQPERRVSADTVVLDQQADTALLTGDVVVTQGRNVLRGGRLAIDRKAGTAKLANPAATGLAGAGRISTTLYQSQAGKPAAPLKEGAADAEQGLGLLGASFKSDPNAPIEVEAATLDVNDRKHTAVYLGSVVAKQGEFVVRTEEMTAHYAGETGLLAGAQPSVSSAAKEKSKGGPAGSELKRIEARRNVSVTGKEGQQATGEWANFDVKANTIVMGGNVTVMQGKQLVRAPAGMRLVIDLGTGVTRFEADPGAASAKGGPQVSGAFATSVAPTPGAGGNPAGCPPGAICKSGRLEAIFYPNQIKDQAKQKLDAAGPVAGEAAAAAKEAARGVAKRLPSSPSWNATSRPSSTP